MKKNKKLKKNNKEEKSTEKDIKMKKNIKDKKISYSPSHDQSYKKEAWELLFKRTEQENRIRSERLRKLPRLNQK